MSAADDSLHKIDKAYLSASNALRNATDSPSGTTAVVISPETARQVQSIILRQQETLPNASGRVGAPTPELRGLGLHFFAVGSHTFAFKPDEDDSEGSPSRLAHFAESLLSQPKGEHTDFVVELFVATPPSHLEGRLALTGLAFVLHWRAERRRRQQEEAQLQRLRIPTTRTQR